MKRIPTVKSVMTPFPYSIGIDEPLTAAAEMMREHEFRHLPVVKGGELVGVLSERLVGEAAERGKQSASRLKVRDAPIGEAYIVGLEEPLDNVVLRMADRHLGSALVVKEGRLAGIFTSTDACRCLGEYLRSEFPVGGDDVA